MTTIAASNQGRVTALLGFEEGDADGSVHGDNLDDVLGDLGDSDEEGDEADIHHDGLLLRTVLEGSNQSIGDDADNIDMFAGEELQYGLQRRGSRSINGAPDGWHPPGPPKDWAGYDPKVELGAPQLDAVENPGSWNLFSFEAKYGVKEKELKKKTTAMAEGEGGGGNEVKAAAEIKEQGVSWTLHAGDGEGCSS